jgi:hypothetical protein
MARCDCTRQKEPANYPCALIETHVDQWPVRISRADDKMLRDLGIEPRQCPQTVPLAS